MVAENKTKATKQSPTAFINSIEDTQQRADAKKVAAMMRKATGARATMWGSSMVGFGHYHYKYASGKGGDFMLTGFAPRKQALTIYIMTGFDGFKSLMEKLGKYKTGKSCLYVKNLSDIDEQVFRSLIKKSLDHFKK